MIRKSAIGFLVFLWIGTAFPQNAPVSVLSATTVCLGTQADITVTVSDFTDIGAISLTWFYDPAVLSFQSFTNNSGFPGLIVMSPTPGVITAAGFSIMSGITLPDGAVLFTAHFITMAGISSLEWFDNGESCEYTGPPPGYQVLIDTPQELYYINGSINVVGVPLQAGAIAGPPGGNVCLGQEEVLFQIDPLPDATGYFWTLPPGCQIVSGGNTHAIMVSISGNAVSGQVTVLGSNVCGEGLPSPAFPLTVNVPPVITSQPVSPEPVIAELGTAGFTVEATGSELSYQWQEYADFWVDLTEGGFYEGVNAETLTISDPPQWMDGYKYRCIVSGFCDPPVVTNGLSTLTVLNITGLNDILDRENKKKSIKIFMHPNPFKNWIFIDYLILLPGQIKIEIINPKGEIIEMFVENHASKGSHTFCYHVKENLNGIYFARIFLKTKQGADEETVKMIRMN